MKLLIRVLIAGLVLVLLIGAAVWWYLFGPSAVTAAKLVPSGTLVFVSIPNAADLATGYQTSDLKKLIDSPNTQPAIDAVLKWIGPKNLDLIQAFLPNLSGQSFIAFTHFDPDKPNNFGFVAGMKPKPGLESFDAFVDKLKAAYPNEIKMGTLGTGNVDGIDYQSIQGPGAPDKICVAKVGGWIITAWGEDSLKDWIERYQGKSSSPSLAENADYKKSLGRLGKSPMALVYLDYHAMIGLLGKQMNKANPSQGDYFTKKFASIGGLAVGSRFEQGEIVDRLSILMPHQAQLDAGGAATPCAFETLNYTSTDTRFYFGSSMNWQQYWKNLQEQNSQMPSPLISNLVNSLQTWAQSENLDLQHNIIDPLGNEFSVQVEWAAETPYPEADLLMKLDKPDDFKPTINAIIDTVRKQYANSAVVSEINSNGHNFATLKFVNPVPLSPTITEDGPYFGLFLTETQAARTFQRDESVGLLHNPDFIRQIGDKRNGASQIIFLDSPQLLDRGYRTVQPYLTMAAMFSKELAALMKDQTLPPDLAWLAPMGTWSMVTTPDDEGVKVYSTSGIGNQGILTVFTGAAGFGVYEGMRNQMNPGAGPGFGPPPNQAAPSSGTPPGTPPMPAPAPPAPAPDAMGNPPPAPNPAPDATPPPAAMTTRAPAANPPPDATAPTPTPTPAPTQ